MAVPAVIRIFVFVVVLAVAELIVQLCIQPVSHELGNGILKQVLDVIHAVDIGQLQELSELIPAFLFFWSSVPSCHM